MEPVEAAIPPAPQGWRRGHLGSTVPHSQQEDCTGCMRVALTYPRMRRRANAGGDLCSPKPRAPGRGRGPPRGCPGSWAQPGLSTCRDGRGGAPTPDRPSGGGAAAPSTVPRDAAAVAGLARGRTGQVALRCTTRQRPCSRPARTLEREPWSASRTKGTPLVPASRLRPAHHPHPPLLDDDPSGHQRLLRRMLPAPPDRMPRQRRRDGRARGDGARQAKGVQGALRIPSVSCPPVPGGRGTCGGSGGGGSSNWASAVATGVSLPRGQWPMRRP